MNLTALFTSAGINIAFCAILLSLYSVLRKQPSNVTVYFARKLLQSGLKRDDSFCFDRLVPSPGWIKKAWEISEQELLSLGGLDAVAFLRIIVFSMRAFSIAAVVCIFLVLPLNYYGQDMHHDNIPSESLEVFTIVNVQEGSKWLWVHCLALYIISCSTCVLLYIEYKSITSMRLAHITGSPPNPSHFSVLVRSIPKSSEQSYSDLVQKFFTNYHGSGYLSHQMIYESYLVHKMMTDAYKMIGVPVMTKTNAPSLLRGGLCGAPQNSFKILSNDPETIKDKVVLDSGTSGEEGASAFVFFKTRYAAVVATQVFQSSNPMSWVTDMAPEPHDVYWSNLCVPYRQLWIRKIATLLAAIVFMFLFLIPVTFVQGLAHLEQLQKTFPFLRGILKQTVVSQVVTGYLPSVILILFLYTVPPTMMLFSTMEGCTSRSGRKKSACIKVLYFTIWNVFFVNTFSGSVITHWSVFSSVKELPTQLARALSAQAGFFTTYVLTSGWASLGFEVVQAFPLLWNYISILILKKGPSDDTYTFPYHTEIPKVLLFGLLGFTCAIMAPLILPFLLVYFFLAYLVYRNQILNVYLTTYESGGKFWPIVHNTTIFSLVLAQIIAMGVFGLKQSPVASGFTVPLVIGTLLFNAFCSERFRPIFESSAASVLIEMDREDERTGRMAQIHRELLTAYYHPKHTCPDSSSRGGRSNHSKKGSIRDPDKLKPGNVSTQVYKS